MKDIKWYLNRLRAMSMPEILWRLKQRETKKIEYNMFQKQCVQVIESVFYQEKENFIFHKEKLSLPSLDIISEESNIDWVHLPGGYDYTVYRKKWHAGFQTKNQWPLTFSYKLSYKQQDEIGDARTNWELNRHFQFGQLACKFYRTGKERYLIELLDLFADWNEKNPFLYGISWTSVMEIAIRDINWIFSLGFLTYAQQKLVKRVDSNIYEKVKKLCEALRIGIINMTSYISMHYSRYSSANNHVIIEAAAIGIAGIVMECKEWYDIAFSILQYEIGHQNYKDGVNKEQSLHYQAFFMEAVGLFVLIMQINGLRIPQNWRNTLCKMSRYISDCCGNYQEVIEFGDNDEGKILDFAGKAKDKREKAPLKWKYYCYVLQLMSLTLPERYVEGIEDYTLLCIAPEKIINGVSNKPFYENHKSVCYIDGGVTIFKSRDGRALIGIDHGNLGFGTIAAHGHADALSFQMYLDGQEIFADAGTYIYHIDLENRNAFRKTENHNTITLSGRDQSEMLGAFLWGKRAETKLLQHNLFPEGNVLEAKENIKESRGRNNIEGIYIEAEHNGYKPIIHRRRFEFDGKNHLWINDRVLFVEEQIPYQVNFLLGKDCIVKELEQGIYEIRTERKKRIRMQIESPSAAIVVREAWISQEYGKKERTVQICVNGKTDKDVTISTMIKWE